MSHIRENATWHIEKLLLPIIQATSTKSYGKISGKDTHLGNDEKSIVTDLNFCALFSC